MTDLMFGIHTENLCKSYKGVAAVDHLSLSIPKGCFFALLGMNGAGKTTTLRMLSGLTKPDSGEAYLGGYSIRTQPEKMKELLGVSPQATAVAENLTVKENLELLATLHGKRGQEKKIRAEECMKRLSLEAVAHKRAKTLSGGYQRRLSIAMALIGDPEILFLDEPTLGLDVVARRELWTLLSTLKGKTTVILTTHYLEEAEALADQIGIMANGRMCATGSVQELCEKTACHTFEDAFLACVQEGSTK